MTEPYRIGHVTVDHPREEDRRRGATSTYELSFYTPKGVRRVIPLTLEQHAKLVADASRMLSIRIDLELGGQR